MENKNLLNAEQQLITQLLEVVNSKEEFEYLNSFMFIQMKGGARYNGN